MAWTKKIARPEPDVVRELREDIIDRVKDVYEGPFNQALEHMVEGSLVHQQMDASYLAVLTELKDLGLENAKFCIEEAYMQSQVAHESFSDLLDETLTAHSIPTTTISAQQRHDIAGCLRINCIAIQLFNDVMLSSTGVLPSNTGLIEESQQQLTNDLAKIFGDNHPLAHSRVVEFTQTLQAMDMKETADKFYRIVIDSWLEEHHDFIDGLLAEPCYRLSREQRNAEYVKSFVSEVFYDALRNPEPAETQGLWARVAGKKTPLLPAWMQHGMFYGKHWTLRPSSAWKEPCAKQH